MFPQKEMGGGSGLKYETISSIVYLSKKKEKMEQKLWEILYIVKTLNQDLQLKTKW